MNEIFLFWKQHPRLVKKIERFVRDPVSDICLENLPGGNDEWDRVFRQHSWAKKPLSAILRVNQAWDEDEMIRCLIKRQELRIFLLGADGLNDLAHLCGMAALSARVKREISGANVRRMIMDLGEDLYRKILTQDHGQWKDLSLALEPLKWMEPSPRPESWLEEHERLGRLPFALLLAGCPLPFQNRVMWKFPPGQFPFDPSRLSNQTAPDDHTDLVDLVRALCRQALTPEDYHAYFGSKDGSSPGGEPLKEG